MKFSLDRNGYITKFLVAGRKESRLRDSTIVQNQLEYEIYLRNNLSMHEDLEVSLPVRLGEKSQIGCPWEYYYSHGNIFMDASAFYMELNKVDMLAACQLWVNTTIAVKACIYSYCAVDLWLNGSKEAVISRPVYKPIQRCEMTLLLHPGNNDLLVRLETLGVRDTRVAFALQILEHTDEIRVTIPDEENAIPYAEAEKILDHTTLKENILYFPESLPQGSIMRYDTENIDYRMREKRFIIEEITGRRELVLRDYASFCVRIPVLDKSISRNFERIELREAKYLPTDTLQGNHHRVFQKIAEITSIEREETDGFAIYPLLARYYMGLRTKEDEAEIYVTLEQIERRMDCADFMTCGLIRLMKSYSLSEEIEREIKRVMLNFRYWMDEEGIDCMCFWSENHSLMFAQTAYFFGLEYPNDHFLRSGKSGKELSTLAKTRIMEWLEDVCSYGYDEFNSGVYSIITFAAILNLYDFAEAEIAEKAKQAADLLIITIARHCFKKVVISPQGRVYRNVVMPQKQDLNALIQFMDPEAPYVYSEWLAALATSRYEFPDEARARMNSLGEYSYNTSNALIHIFKTQEYMLTSVASPRGDTRKRIWENRMTQEERDTFHYTKSLNEYFHGTTQFEPGVHGYQQHMWYAALDENLSVFTNHPGQTCDAKAEVRPGYWYGNGIMPALQQVGNTLGIIYEIPEAYPVKFTHLFWNERAFDEIAEDGKWLFGRKGEAYIAIWCSGELEDCDDVLFHCEKRTYGDKIAYVCICGSSQKNKSFCEFMDYCRKEAIKFDAHGDTLYCCGFQVNFTWHEDIYYL